MKLSSPFQAQDCYPRSSSRCSLPEESLWRKVKMSCTEGSQGLLFLWRHHIAKTFRLKTSQRRSRGSKFHIILLKTVLSLDKLFNGITGTLCLPLRSTHTSYPQAYHIIHSSATSSASQKLGCRGNHQIIFSVHSWACLFPLTCSNQHLLTEAIPPYIWKACGLKDLKTKLVQNGKNNIDRPLMVKVPKCW